MTDENTSDSIPEKIPASPDDEDTLKRAPYLPASPQQQLPSLLLPGDGPFATSTPAGDTVAEGAVAANAQETVPVSGSILPPMSKTPLHEGPTAPQHVQMQGAAPPPQQPWMAGAGNARPGGRGAGYKLQWVLVTISALILIAIVLGLFFYVLPALSSHRDAFSQLAPPATATLPTATPSPAPTHTTATSSGLAIVPDHFSPANCQVDNGYRCTATLMDTQGDLGALPWTAYGSGIATKFSPSVGSITQGQQQQVIIYIYTPCPTTGSFVFSVGGHKTLASWSC